jgi:hypothetical protein
MPRTARPPAPLLQTEFNERQVQFSPDTRWVAYVSDESGRPEICVQRFPVSSSEGSRMRISVDGGGQPRWRRDGRAAACPVYDRRAMALHHRAQSASAKPFRSVAAVMCPPPDRSGTPAHAAPDGQERQTRRRPTLASVRVATHHYRGVAMCANGLELRREVVEPALLSAIEGDILRPFPSWSEPWSSPWPRWEADRPAARRVGLARDLARTEAKLGVWWRA